MAKFDVSEWIRANMETREEMIQKADGRTIFLLALRPAAVATSQDGRELADAAVDELGRRLDLASPPKT